MSAVDTPEAVEEMAAGCDYYAAGEAAAMLRRLHARSLDLTQQVNDDNVKMNEWRDRALAAEAALATARADALREAAATLPVNRVRWGSPEEHRDRILALIPEKPHAE